MKKLLCIAAFAGLFGFGYCQDVKVNINNQEATTKEDCPYRINGICSTEDIGGVDVQFSFKVTDEYGHGDTKAVFTNYNNFPVTVLYQIHYRLVKDNAQDHIGSIVLGVESSKEIVITNGRDCSMEYIVTGIIVRKLQK